MSDKSLTPVLVDPDEGMQFAGIDVHKIKESSKWLNILVYGMPGAGKTRFAGSAAEVSEMTPMLYIDVEGGTKSIKDLYPDVDTVRVKTIYDKGGRAKKTAWGQLNDIYSELKKGEIAYQTVVIDNITEAYQLAMQDVMTKLLAENPDRDFDVPAQREWGKASAQMRRWIRNMRDLDLNVIITAHEANQTDDNGNVKSVTPSLPGKLAMEVAGFFDEVFYIYTKQDKELGIVRKLQTQPAGKYIAKDRSDKLPLVVSDPKMAVIYQEVI